MTSEEIARKYEDLPGFELVDYAEAALPLWQLNVEVVSVIRRGLQPIREFTLRTLEAGLGVDELPGFLGLDDGVIRGVLADLASDKFVTLGERAAVTELGRKALREGLSSPTNEMLPVIFDGILRKPVASSIDEFAYPREVEDGSVAEIPATPASPPVIEDLALVDIDQVLDAGSSGRADVSRDILRLKRIVRRRRLFGRAVALIFRSKKGEVRTRFIINGVPDDRLEQTFAENGGNLRKGLVRVFSDSHVRANLRSHLGQEAAKRVLQPEDYSHKQAQVSFAALKVAALLRRTMLVEHGQLPPSERPTAEALKSAALAEKRARAALDTPDVRPAAVYEKAELLARALKDVERSLSISTRGLAPHIVNEPFLKRLKALRDKGVHITISLHKEAVDWRARGRDWARAVDTCVEWSKKDPGRFVLRTTNETRYYHLAWDSSVALVANRPMLSNHGRTRAFEQFAGFVLQDANLVSSYLERVNK